MFLYIWITIGCLLLICELITASFFLIFLGVAALLVASALFFFSISVISQTLLFLFLSMTFLIFLRKIFMKKSSHCKDMPSPPVGECGIAFDDIEINKPGRVIIRDTIWKATSKTPIKKGTSIQVIAKNNLTLEVL